MKRTCYKALILWALMFGFLMLASQECSASEVMSISANTVVRDCLETESDINSYMYTVNATGYITVDFVADEQVTDAGKGWDIHLYDEAQRELCVYREIKSDISSPKLNFAPGTKLYVKVCASYMSYAPLGQVYSLRVNAVTRHDWEVETGRTAKDSWESRICGVNSLTPQKRYGSLWTGDDNDVYQLCVAGTEVVTLQFWTQGILDELGWGYDIEIYKKNGSKLTGYKQIKATAQKMFYAKPGIYYVVVKANWSNAAPKREYAIAATSKEVLVPSMRGKKIAYVPQTSTVKWGKAKHVDGYEIYVCKNKKFKKKNTTVYSTIEKSYRLPKRLRKGFYYIKIRAYCETLTGDRIYGKFSKVKKIRKKKR